MTSSQSNTARRSNLDRLVDEWHNGAGAEEALHEYLGWTWDEYRAYVERGVFPPEREGSA